jgi:hypothetical protein
LKATITEEWQDDGEEENYMQWYELSSYSMESPISLEGNTLTIAMPLGEDGSLINVSLKKNHLQILQHWLEHGMVRESAPYN